eukprot:CAMPEP_0113693260 /NCGR_PEP_ID=MMETSP0038_2-20120614/19563_1 /TAXON_ID=2898 /ORGANISM="Cryptomonas paramecium" /LENGTH=34 /DNA_ID=CAMNT_0000615307 /DNA_START=181 /DNA_END=282 /DNA_ORIENTATION=+ /assembly_acc=CAM_ASM_000170
MVCFHRPLGVPAQATGGNVDVLLQLPRARAGAAR